MYAYRRTPLALPVALVATALIVWGCSSTAPPRRMIDRSNDSRGPALAPTAIRFDRWRAMEEQACLASGVVRPNQQIAFRNSLGGPGACTAIRPFEVAALGPSQIAFVPPAVMQCPMVPAVEHWLTTAVSPAARLHFGSDVVQIKVISSYSCRAIANTRGRLSEHGRANALDVSAFHLADGRTVTVKQGWRGGDRERAFLRDVHRGACATFTTVLGPNANAYHHDHFHVDLARHGRDGSYRVCR